MTDRFVRQLVPEVATQAQRRPFSEYDQTPNIVLLGAPGAGKTHLFVEAAAKHGSRVTTRDFLNIPTFPDATTLFIDALDEHRAGRGDQSTIDAVVKKLFEVHPKRVRIACRESDWLGSTDLAAFQPYFERNGGYVVLALEQLTEEEQRTVLQTYGVKNPSDFLKQAVERGLTELLTNPQNLVMLAQSVADRNWPRNRTELFQNATTLLLSEHNASRARSGDGIYGPDELRAPAGSILATRLISDVGGVSLTDAQVTEEYPSYRTTPFPEREKVRAALGRRVFVGSGDEIADYTHRTTAEYLGAAWLAKQIQGGLPIGRVRALMGVDGHPASELRGLNAWLAVHCPDHSSELIDADPYGVLIYGDAGSLSPSHRKRLLSAFALLSETDPWFSRDEHTAPNVGALSSSDLEPDFRAILKSKTAHFTLKRLVLSALATGAPPPMSLSTDLRNIFLDTKASYALRDLAFDGLKKLGGAGIGIIKQAYTKLGRTESDIRLRATVLADLYQYFSPSDGAAVLKDALACPDDLVSGIFISFDRAVPPEDILPLIESLDASARSQRDANPKIARAQRHNTFDVGNTISRLIVKYLKNSGSNPLANVVWKMLLSRQRLEASLSRRSSEELHAELQARPDLLAEILEKAIDELDDTTPDHAVVWKFRETTLRSLNEQLLAARISMRALAGNDSKAKQALLYELAIQLVITEVNRAEFDKLYTFAEDHPHLLIVRDRNVVQLIDDWRREDAERASKQALDEERDAATTRNAFERDKHEIASGKHLGWIGWLSRIYFDTDEDGTPHQRLERRIGAGNVGVALSAFEAALQRTDVPSVNEVRKANIRNSYPFWWYAIIAAMDERWGTQPTLAGLSDELLEKAAAIQLVLITQRREGNTIFNLNHPWRDALLSKRTERMADIYARVASATLEGKAEIAHGLHELISEDAFSDVRNNVLLKLLSKYRAAPAQELLQMLSAVLTGPDTRDKLRTLVKAALSLGKKLASDQRSLWLAAGFLITPSEFKSQIQSAGKKPEIVWRLRSLLRSRSGQGYSDLTVEQLEIIIRIAGRHFPVVPMPSSYWGDENAWDGSQFCRELIDALSTRTIEEATTAFARLIQLPSLISHQDYLKHQLANQQTRRREAEYRQPDWAQAAATLQNGPPANFADLQALVLDHCRDLNNEITNRNVDIYRQFWNEGPHGRITKPRSEETSRDLLVTMLQARLRQLGITVEPERHMAADKRVDVSVALNHKKTMMEWKRDYHPDVWHAHSTQLDRLYTPDPDASGYGIYGIFWFGSRRPRRMPARPDGGKLPKTAREMQEILTELLPIEKRKRLSVVVLDVSGPVGAHKKAKPAKSPGKKRGSTSSRKVKVIQRRVGKSAAKKARSKRKSKA